MARDPGLETQVREDLGEEPGLGEMRMFGGLAWTLNGNLLCAAREEGLLIRLGKGQDRWALGLDGVEPLAMRGRPMSGWIWAGPQAYADDALRRRLLDAALAFVRALPPK
jgi:hypothetical protein